jgi:hypothetical protein
VIALRTTHVTPLRRASPQAALRRWWRPGDAVVIRWFTQPTPEELEDDAYVELEHVLVRAGACAFTKGFELWLDAGLDASQITQAVAHALRTAR